VALTDDERNLVHQTFMQGPSVLMEAGYVTHAQIQEFLERPDVQAEWRLLQREFDAQDAIFDRTKFGLKRQLSRLGPGAVSILAHTMAGPVYARNDNGHILTDARGHPIILSPSPTALQLTAAREVLDRVGVEGKMEVDKGADLNIEKMCQDADSEAVSVEHDPKLLSFEERALSRERVRTVIDQIAEKLPEIQQEALTQLSPPKKPRRKTKGKKKTRKKARKKASAAK
jgi:hypothetical protein